MYDHQHDPEVPEEFGGEFFNEGTDRAVAAQSRPNKGRPLPPVETRWKKGVSGNPRGRPKKQKDLENVLRRLLGKVCRTDRESRTYGELFIQALLQSALKGNATASKLIWDRHDGKAARTDPAQDDRIRSNGAGREPSRDSSEPIQLSTEAINRIRSIYGLDPINSRS